MKTIIAISGKQRSGKDTLAAFLLAYLPGWRRIALADALKDEYCHANGIDRAMIDGLKNQDPAMRSELIAWGGMRRAEDPGYWVKQVLAQAPKIIVPDMRFLNEANAFLETGALMVRLDSDESVRAQRGILSNMNDPSETELDRYTLFDTFLYKNGSLEQLKNLARQITQMIDQSDQYPLNVFK